MKNCKCGGKAIVEHGFIGELNSSGKFVCCLECERQTKVYLDPEEAKAIDDWENNRVAEGIRLYPTKYNFEQFKNQPEVLYKAKR